MESVAKRSGDMTALNELPDRRLFTDDQMTFRRIAMSDRVKNRETTPEDKHEGENLESHHGHEHGGARGHEEDDGHHGQEGHLHHEQGKEYCFEFDTNNEAKKYETKLHEVTPERIREIVKLPPGTAIVEILEDGTQRTLREGEEVHLHHCSKFRKLPRFTRGRGRLEADLEAVKREFKNAIIGPNNEYFVLPGFLLPDLFTQRTTDLLVVASPTYPTAAPANFHVTWGLTLKTGDVVKNYSGPANLYGRIWGTFSHGVAAETWNGDQDNFLNFIATVRARLQEGA